MKTIKLGSKEFEFNAFTPETFKLLEKNIKLLTINPSKEEGKSDIGDVILFLLIAIFGDEDKAMEEGLKLQEIDQKNVTEEQLNCALDVLNEMNERFCSAIKMRKMLFGHIL